MSPSIDVAALRRSELGILRSLCAESFLDFARLCWPVIEPTRALVPSVAFDATCIALQAVAERRIRRLAEATCPGTSKSLLGAVAFPAWLLYRTHGTERIMVGSYSWDFALRDSRRCRDLIDSEWYRALVDGEWSIRDDANKESDYWTTSGGRRFIASVGGKALGERCTTQIVDDALSGSDIHSPAAKREAARWISEVLPSRLEDQDHDARIVIGQRLCVDDPLAGVLERGWSYLSLPAVLSDDSQRCDLRDDAGALVWRDERALGEPLMSLLGIAALEKLRVDLGSTAFASQYLQRPADDSTAIVKRSWWRFWRAPHVPTLTPRPAGCDVGTPAAVLPDAFDRIVIACDLTFGSLDGDYAVAQAWGAVGNARYLLEQWRERAGFDTQLAAIHRLKKRYPNAAIVVEKAANGAAVVERLKLELTGVMAVKPQGKKEARLSAVAPTIESGCCYLPLGTPWLDDFVEELSGGGKHDDSMDACAYALHDLAVSFIEPAPAGPILYEHTAGVRSAPRLPIADDDDDGGFGAPILRRS